jgi:hypothetical protein
LKTVLLPGLLSPHLARLVYGGFLMSSTTSFVGIDVSKDSLEIFVRPVSQHWSIANNSKEIANLIASGFVQFV